jgi:predicted secreted protein
MKTPILSFLFLLITFLSCEAGKGPNKETEPASVSIISPENNSIIKDTVIIVCESSNNDEVYKIDLWVNGDSIGVADSTAPYALSWETKNYKNGSYSLFVRSYDSYGNTTDSETITIIIDNFLIYKTTFGFEGTSEAGHSILQTMDSNFVILGSTGEDILLLKTNHAGDKLWHQTFGGSQTDEARHIQQTSDGGYIISGTTRSYGSGGLDIWVIKTDASGLIEWNKYYGSSEDEHGGQVQQTPDGGYAIIGDMSNPENGDQDLWLIKTNSLGDITWNRTYGGTNDELGFDLQLTEDGGFLLLGSTRSIGSGGADIWIIKTDISGNPEWDRSYGGGSDDHGQSIIQTHDGGYLVRSKIESFGDGNTAIGLLRLSASGEEIWTKSFGGSNGESGNAISQTNNNGYILVCSFYDHGDSAFDIWLVNINDDGTVIWDRTFGDIKTDIGFSTLQTKDGGFALVGSTYNYGTMDETSDLWLIKTDPSGNTTTLIQ